MKEKLFELNGAEVQRLREKSFLTRKELAKQADFGEDTIEQIEKGTRTDGRPTRVQEAAWLGIAKVLKVEPRLLLAGASAISGVPAALRDCMCSFDAFVEDRTQGFVGRKFVFEAIERFRSTKPSGYFVVSGQPGIGKSAIVAQLVKTRGCIHHFNIASQGINIPHSFSPISAPS